MIHPFKGVGVALVTPFSENSTIDFNALQQIIHNQVEGGTDYLVALGTTAETPTLSGQERKDVVKFVKEHASGLPVVVGLGGNDTKKIIKQMNKLDYDGISGLLMVTPYYNKPSQEGMFRHYSTVAKESPVPIILYNVPSRTGINLEAETVVKLANSSEKFAGVKEASGIMSQIARIRKYAREDFLVISGDDVLALPIISMGGAGVISVITNALPGKMSSLIHHALEGNYPQARELHMELIDLFVLLFKDGNPGGIKALMNIQGTIKNELRSPLTKISDATWHEIKEAFDRLKM
jgi:4-hydroxy-tetrahydrodipicolinate synthase